MESKAEAMKREARHTAASAETEAEASRRLANEAKRREAEAHDQVCPQAALSSSCAAAAGVPSLTAPRHLAHRR